MAGRGQGLADRRVNGEARGPIAQKRIFLATAESLPRDDAETPRLAQHLRQLGVYAEIVPWTDRSVDWSSAGSVVIRSTWDYTNRLEEFLDWADRVGECTRLFNPAEVVRWNHHKRYLIELADAGLPVVPTALVPTASDATTCASAIDATDAESVVVKPAVDAGGRGALCALRAGPDFERLVDHAVALAAQGDVLIQPMIESVRDRGELSIVCFHGEPALARRKVPARGEFRVHEHHGGRTESVALDDELREAATDSIQAAADCTACLGETGSRAARFLYSRVDLARIGDRLHLMELELIEPFLYLETDDEFAVATAAIIETLD